MPDEARCPRVPFEWLREKRTVVCMGGMDTGKTTLVRSMFEELRNRGERVFHVDLDMGQSTIGPPTTIGLEDPRGRVYLCFVGNVSPCGVVTQIRDGLVRFGGLLRRYKERRAVVDTAGLVAGTFGWLLKRMEIESLGADAAVVIDRSGESAHVVRGIREMGIDCLVLHPSGEARTRKPEERRQYRKQLFEEYFRGARITMLSLRGRDCSPVGKAVAGPGPEASPGKKDVDTIPWEPGQVLGLLDARGFLVRLALLRRMAGERMSLLAPTCAFRQVKSVRFGRYVIEEGPGRL
jgi:polynucleotide 5'-hydroxyl-kinase GRC3/NOL9